MENLPKALIELYNSTKGKFLTVLIKNECIGIGTKKIAEIFDFYSAAKTSGTSDYIRGTANL